MTRFLEFRFKEQNILARARLLQKEMPRTCREIIDNLPLKAMATHARYSGSEVAMLLSTDIKVEREKATCAVETGDVAPGYSGVHRRYFTSRHEFRFFNRLLNRKIHVLPPRYSKTQIYC